MIKVNLAARKRSVNVAPASSGSALGAIDFKDLMARLRSGNGLSLRDNPVAKKTLSQLAIFAVVGYGVNYFIEDYKAREIAKVVAQNDEIRSKLKLINSEINKTAGYEKLKADLEADEKMIHNKINTIQKLVDDRTTPPKILIALSQATPKDVWLNYFELKGPSVTFRGQATGLDVVTDFIRSLEETVYFKNVQLKSSSNVRDKGVDLSTFDLEAVRR